MLSRASQVLVRRRLQQATMLQFQKRFEGGYPWFDSEAQKLPHCVNSTQKLGDPMHVQAYVKFWLSFEAKLQICGTRDVTKGIETYLDETEVQTRMSQVLFNFKLFDLHNLDWDAALDEIGIDEYEQTAVLTSIEHEFHTVFEDRIFESFKSLNDIKSFIASDHNCF